LISDGKDEFDQDVFAFGNHFKIEYEQLLKAYNGGQCAMVLIKNVEITSKRDGYLKAQQYTILINVVDEVTQAHLFKLHNKFSIVQPIFKEINFFLLILFKNILNFFFKVKEKNSMVTNVHLYVIYTFKIMKKLR